MSARSLTVKARVPPILPDIRKLIEKARQHVAATANLSMVGLYWNIGRIITRDMQRNKRRAGYGEELVDALSGHLIADYGQGFSSRNLWDMKRFFAHFHILQAAPAEFNTGRIRQTASNESAQKPILQAVPAESERAIIIDFKRHCHLGWTHYRILMGVGDTREREFYFEQAATQRWATRELEREIASALYQRVIISRDTRKLIALEKKKGPPEVVQYDHIFKDPYVLDFLGLKGAYSEKDLEAAIIRNLEQFLS